MASLATHCALCGRALKRVHGELDKTVVGYSRFTGNHFCIGREYNRCRELREQRKRREARAARAAARTAVA